MKNNLDIRLRAFVTRAFLILTTVFFSFPLFSQDSLSFYLQTAAKNNPGVIQKYTEFEAALQKIPQAGSLQDPEVQAGVFLEPMEILSGKQIADLRLMQMFPWFGTLKAAKDEMSFMAKAKFETFRDAKLQVSYDVQRTWYELYKIRKDISISEKNLQILKTLERLALVRFRTSAGSAGTTSSSRSSNSQTPTSTQGFSGMQTMGNQPAAQSGTGSSSPMPGSSMQSTGSSGLADLYRIQIEIKELENNIALLRNQQSTVTARFNSFLNRPVRTEVFVVDTLTADSLNIPLPAVSDSMLRNNPMLTMLQYEQQSLEARKKMVTRMGYPMIGLGLNYSVVTKSDMSTSPMNGKDMIMPMATVTIPIYRKKYKAMQKEAELSKTATAQNFQATANDLQTQMYQAIQLYQDAYRRINLYTEQSELANRTLNILLKSFSSGSALTDILSVRQQTLDYDLKKIESVADYNTAVALLKRLGSF